MTDDSVRPETEALMSAGAAASERFIVELKALEIGWRDNKLGEVVDKLKQRLIDEYDGNTEPIAAGSASG